MPDVVGLQNIIHHLFGQWLANDLSKTTAVRTTTTRYAALARFPDSLARQGMRDLLREPAPIDRLADQAVEAGCTRLGKIIWHDISGECHYPRVVQARSRADLSKDRVAVIDRNLQV